MNPNEAKNILDKYFQILQETEDKCVAREETLLPCSKDELRKAHFVYVEELIIKDAPFEKIDPLINSFNRIVTFIKKERAEQFNKLWEKLKSGNVSLLEQESKPYKEYIEYGRTDYLGFEPTYEMMDFIDKVCRENGKPSLVYKN